LPGPASLFQQTLRYGRALAALFPAVAAVPDWSLDAKCLLGTKMARFHADASDPIVAPPSQDIDNAVERRLSSDFRRLGSSWSLVRAMQPLRTNTSTFFPDFTLERGMDRVHIEIVGFHTAAYLEAKQEALRDAGLSSVVLCVDDSLACSERTARATPNVFRFQRRIEVGQLLRAIEGLPADRDAEPSSDQPSS
jgi:predicted nuclease of restriction endonuclease-like RecB superfamily